MNGVRKDPSGRTIYKKTDPRFSRNRAYSAQTKFRPKASNAVADVSANSATLKKRIAELEDALALCEVRMLIVLSLSEPASLRIGSLVPRPPQAFIACSMKKVASYPGLPRLL